jgi:carboxymethylenebutenolidase
MPAVLWAPERAGRAPGVLVLMEAYGLTPHIERVAQRLAENGYAALAPDLFYRFQRRQVSYEDPRGAAAMVMRAIALSSSPEERAKDDRGLADIEVALDALGGHPAVAAPRLAVVGFGMGGHLAFLAACRFADRIQAAVVYQGTRLVPVLSEARHLEAPLLMVFGGRDPAIPPAQIDRIRAELEYFEKAYRIDVYSDASVGFFCEDRESYCAESAGQACQESLAWLRKQLL